jgi:hypothetical protein
MTNKANYGNKTCPHCSEEHSKETVYCPNIGKRIITWGPIIINGILGTIIFILIVALLTIPGPKIQESPTDKNPLDTIEKKQLPEPLKKAFQTNEIALEYRAKPGDPDLGPDMAKAFLEQFGASGVTSHTQKNKGIMISGLIKDKDKSLTAKIFLIPPATKIVKVPAKEIKNQSLELERVKTQLTAATIKCGDFETKLTESEKQRNELSGTLKEVTVEKETIQKKLDWEIADKIDIEKKKQAEEKKRKRLTDNFFNDYYNLAKDFYRAADWQNAQKYINKAKALKITYRLRTLEKNIKGAINSSHKIYDYGYFSKETREKHMKEFKLITMENIPGNANIKENSQVTFIFIINEKGRVNVKEMIDKNFKVEPGSQKKSVIEAVKSRIKKMILSPFRNEAGKPVKVKTWRFTFEATVINGILLLRRS